jgi:pimeloyl-ACP methyl ester carboxylesterase
MQIAQRNIGSFVVTEHRWDVPVDYNQTSDTRYEPLSLFAREVTTDSPERLTLPTLVFLQGGPGFEATRPSGGFGWVARAAERYRVVLLDQRGTGQSTPISADTIGKLGTPQQQADYLTRFRADAIVQDCEFVRQAMGLEQWTVLGQSFGGFCALHYMSAFPSSLREALFTGGVPPIGRSPDDVYRKTYARMIDRNVAYFDRYPEDITRVRDTLRTLSTSNVRLPSGDRLTPNRFRTLGLMLGMSTGAEEMHYIVERGLDHWALRAIENAQKWDTNPLYHVLHESSYADGHATKWSAHRLRAEYPQFDDLEDGLPFFTGEHVFPWQLNDWQRLQPFAEAAEILAHHEWPKLYAAATLAHNTVPAAAIVYPTDPYVEAEFSEEVAAAVPGLHLTIMAEHDHDGLRVVGAPILDALFNSIDNR